ncbi:hypothetical protein A6J64_012995 [Yersinia enterocolitica]|nr:hypothetical protein A6J64_012995 [Yersinia enterocolitica]
MNKPGHCVRASVTEGVTAPRGAPAAHAAMTPTARFPFILISGDKYYQSHRWHGRQWDDCATILNYGAGG